MAILGGKFTNDDDDGGGGGEALRLPLDDVVCATCGRELMPWQGACPDDGGAAIPRAQTMAGGPDIPAHLLEGLDEVDGDTDGTQPDGPDPDTAEPGGAPRGDTGSG